MKCVVLLLLLFVFSFVNTQYSKCNIPILRTSFVDNMDFVDLNFPLKNSEISLTTDYSPLSSNNIPFDHNFGSTWSIPKHINYIDIEFSSPVLISSFAINSCVTKDGINCSYDATKDDRIFTFEYQSPNSDSFTRLKPVHYPNGELELSEHISLPTLISFEEIQTDHIQVKKKYRSGGLSETEYFVQLEVYGCATKPPGTSSLNSHIQQYSTVPSYSGYDRNVMQYGWCNQMACSGLRGLLFDGIISYNSQVTDTTHITWELQQNKYPITLTILFNEKFVFTHLVVHCIIKGRLNECIPEILIKGENVQLENKVTIEGTSHGIYRFNHSGNTLEIQFMIQAHLPFSLSEIEFFGEDGFPGTQSETKECDLWQIPIFVSTVYFTITLALIIPLLISVVVVCFKIKKQTLYFPIRQNSFQCTHEQFAPTQQQEYKPQQQHHHPEMHFTQSSEHLNSNFPSFESNIDNTPFGGELIKRVDTNTLNNMYERIPTITTTQGNNFRDSMKRTYKSDPSRDFLTPSPRPKLPEIPVYSVPKKVKNKKTVNRPSSHEGYLELRDMSVEDNSPAFQESENPLYDYIRPRSALVDPEANNSIHTPSPEYINTKQPHEYCNTVNNSTQL